MSTCTTLSETWTCLKVFYVVYAPHYVCSVKPPLSGEVFGELSLSAYLCFSLLTAVCADTLEEFWDYEHQVDLEAFSSNTFYNLLLKQSLSVTTRLGQLTTEVCMP